MMDEHTRPASARISIDGGSRGNPGPASFAVVLERDHYQPIEICDTIGITTNNVAEYTALIKALELAQELGCRSVSIQSDSELLVKQMNGEYKVKSEELKPLYEHAQRLAREFDHITIKHVRREHNKRADQLCNLALDGHPKPWSQASPPSASLPTADDQALSLLQSIAKPSTSPEELERVWRQLKLLAQHQD